MPKVKMIIENKMSDKFRQYFAKTKAGGEVDIKAKTTLGLQLLSNVVNGSERTSVVPPIDTGHLRGSASVFVGDKFIKDSRDQYPDGKPNSSHADKVEVITVGFDTPYAARLHEGFWTPGGKKPSKGNIDNPNKSADAGRKFVEDHLKADKEDLLQAFANMVDAETSK